MNITIDRTEKEADMVLTAVARRNPAILVGGYHVDYLILGAYKALMAEDLSTDEVYERIDGILQVAFAGLI